MKKYDDFIGFTFHTSYIFPCKKLEISFELVKNGDERSILMFYTIKSKYKEVRERDYIIIFKYTTE